MENHFSVAVIAVNALEDVDLKCNRIVLDKCLKVVLQLLSGVFTWLVLSGKLCYNFHV